MRRTVFLGVLLLHARQALAQTPVPGTGGPYTGSDAAVVVGITGALAAIAHFVPTPGGGEEGPGRTPTPLPGAAVRPDGSSVDAIVTGLYASVTHGPEYEPNWERLRQLFLPAAIVVPPKRPDAESFAALDVNAFEQRIRAYIAGRKAKGEALGFTEREIGRRTDCFGNLCQVFSSYETVRAPGDAPFARGVHSIQVVNDGRRWWIAALAWDNERVDNPVPPELSTKRPQPTGDSR